MGSSYSNSMLANCIAHQEPLTELPTSQKHIVNNKSALGYAESNIESRYTLGKPWANLNAAALLKDVPFMHANISLYKSISSILNILKTFPTLFQTQYVSKT